MRALARAQRSRLAASWGDTPMPHVASTLPPEMEGMSCLWMTQINRDPTGRIQKTLEDVSPSVKSIIATLHPCTFEDYWNGYIPILSKDWVALCENMDMAPGFSPSCICRYNGVDSFELAAMVGATDCLIAMLKFVEKHSSVVARWHHQADWTARALDAACEAGREAVITGLLHPKGKAARGWGGLSAEHRAMAQRLLRQVRLHA